MPMDGLTPGAEVGGEAANTILVRGLGTLLHQGALNCEHWTGPPPRSTPCGQPWSSPPSPSSRDISLDKQGAIINMGA
jgi:hypothetical protein